MNGMRRREWLCISRWVEPSWLLVWRSRASAVFTVSRTVSRSHQENPQAHGEVIEMNPMPTPPPRADVLSRRPTPGAKRRSRREWVQHRQLRSSRPQSRAFDDSPGADWRLRWGGSEKSQLRKLHRRGRTWRRRERLPQESVSLARASNWFCSARNGTRPRTSYSAYSNSIRFPRACPTLLVNTMTGRGGKEGHSPYHISAVSSFLILMQKPVLISNIFCNISIAFFPPQFFFFLSPSRKLEKIRSWFWTHAHVSVVPPFSRANTCGAHTRTTEGRRPPTGAASAAALAALPSKRAAEFLPCFPSSSFQNLCCRIASWVDVCASRRAELLLHYELGKENLLCLRQISLAPPLVCPLSGFRRGRGEILTQSARVYDIWQWLLNGPSSLWYARMQ